MCLRGRPACGLAAIFRPQLCGLGKKNYVSDAGKALTAVIFGLCVAFGQVGPRPSPTGQTRLCLPRLVLRRKPDVREAQMQRRLVGQVAQTLAPDETLIVDAGSGLDDLLRVAVLLVPGHGGQDPGPPCPNVTAHWTDGKHRLWAEAWNGLALSDARAVAFWLVAIHAPRYWQPLLLATNFAVSAQALWRLYKDR